MSEQLFWELSKKMFMAMVGFLFVLAAIILLTDFTKETALWAMLISSGFMLLFLKEK